MRPSRAVAGIQSAEDVVIDTFSSHLASALSRLFVTRRFQAFVAHLAELTQHKVQQGDEAFTASETADLAAQISLLLRWAEHRAINALLDTTPTPRDSWAGLSARALTLLVQRAASCIAKRSSRAEKQFVRSKLVDVAGCDPDALLQHGFPRAFLEHRLAWHLGLSSLAMMCRRVLCRPLAVTSRGQLVDLARHQVIQSNADADSISTADARAWRPIASMEHPLQLVVIAVADQMNRIAVWTVDATGMLVAQQRVLFGHTEFVVDFCVLSGPLLVSCSLDTTVRLWNVVTGAQLACFTNHVAVVWSCCRIDQTDGFATVSADGSARLYQGCQELQPVLKRSAHALACAYVPKQDVLLVGYDDGHLVAWRIRGPGAGEQLFATLCQAPWTWEPPRNVEWLQVYADAVVAKSGTDVLAFRLRGVDRGHSLRAGAAADFRTSAQKDATAAECGNGDEKEALTTSSESESGRSVDLGVALTSDDVDDAIDDDDGDDDGDDTGAFMDGCEFLAAVDEDLAKDAPLGPFVSLDQECSLVIISDSRCMRIIDTSAVGKTPMALLAKTSSLGPRIAITRMII